MYSRTSIIRLGNFHYKWACQQLLPWTQELLRMRCCLSIMWWVDQGEVYPFDYLVIRPASGTKVSDLGGSTVFERGDQLAIHCQLINETLFE